MSLLNKGDKLWFYSSMMEHSNSDEQQIVALTWHILKVGIWLMALEEEKWNWTCEAKRN